MRKVPLPMAAMGPRRLANPYGQSLKDGHAATFSNGPKPAEHFPTDVHSAPGGSRVRREIQVTGGVGDDKPHGVRK